MSRASKESARKSHQKYRTGACGRARQTWRAMIQRCTNPLDSRYHNYGGRGIAVCARWFSFDRFLADMGARPDKTSIERVDNDRGYEPGNCRWATSHEQARNKRVTRLITFQGDTLCMADWATRLNMSPNALAARLRRLTVERAFAMPLIKKVPLVLGGTCFRGHSLTASSMSICDGKAICRECRAFQRKGFGRNAPKDPNAGCVAGHPSEQMRYYPGGRQCRRCNADAQARRKLRIGERAK